MSTKGTPHQTIMTTSNYDLFVLDAFNRRINDALVRKKVSLLAAHGWCPGLPMLCIRNSGGKFEIKDGQHRFEAAKRLGIPVWYVVVKDCDLSPSEINAGQKAWALKDFVDSHISLGNAEYMVLRDFSANYRIPLSIAASLLSANGCGTSDGVTKRIQEGLFKVKDQRWAERIGAICREIGEVFQYMHTRNAVSSIARFALVKEFSDLQMIEQCQRYSNMLKPCGTVDQYSLMFEEVYNFQRKVNRLPLKFYADAEARKRSAASPKAGKNG